MNAENARAFIAAFDHIRDIAHRLEKHFLFLGDGCGKKPCNAFMDNSLCPVSQSFRFAIVCVKAIGAMAVDVNEARQDAL